LDQPNATLYVSWVGEVQDQAQHIVNGKPDSFELKVVQVPRTLFELDPGLHVGASPAGSGLEVEYYFVGEPVDPILVELAMESIAGVHVVAVLTEGPVTLL